MQSVLPTYVDSTYFFFGAIEVSGSLNLVLTIDAPKYQGNESLSILTSKFIYIIKSTSFLKEGMHFAHSECDRHMFLNVTRR